MEPKKVQSSRELVEYKIESEIYLSARGILLFMADKDMARADKCPIQADRGASMG